MTDLKKYGQKRDFKKTPEPPGGKPKSKNKNLRFVVHKHEATKLHYDLRLEVDGVLKSWAVPKGPTQDPRQKHLAVMVEDHPFEYKDFEGVIPKNNYGAGPVMIWDEGFYRPIGQLASKDLGQAFKEGVKNGHLVFALAGQKLNGEFALIKLKKGAKNDWLFIKARDWYASDKDVLINDRSARSGKSMLEIRKSATKWPKIDPKTPKTKMPHKIKPMFSTLIKEPFDDKNWIFEIKWDGYRATTEIKSGKTQIYSRNFIQFNDLFPEIAQAFDNFAKDAIFDGEIVAIDKEGRSNFQLLRNKRGPIIYYIFDLIYFDGYDLTSLSLEKRRKILKKILPKASNIQLSDDIRGKGEGFFKLAKKTGLEGIIAKKLTSQYKLGRRTKDWLKIKVSMQQEAIICGYTLPQGSRSGFGSLVLGAYEGGKIVHIGNVGTGFSEQTISELLKIMQTLESKKPVFPIIKALETKINWIEPKLVCEVKFQEWTRDGFMRQPVFLDLREDIAPTEVKREVANER